MADIAPQPFINYGLSQAQQGEAQAGAALKTQQAGAAAMQNQVMAAKMPFIMKMYQQMAATSDTSGVDGQGEPGGPIAARKQTEASVGFDAQDITTRNQSRYGVPEWMGNEQQMNLGAAASGDDGAIKWAAMQRQQRLDKMRQQSQWDSSNKYSAYATAALAGDRPGGSSYNALQQVDPQYINYLDRLANEQHAQGNDIDKEAAARGYARYQAADLHKFTNRPIDFKDGHAIDKDTGLPVAGVPDLQMSPKDQAEFFRAAQTPSIEVQTGIPGQTKKMSPAQVMGLSPHDYLAAVYQGRAPSPDQISTMTAGKPITANELAQLRTNAANKVTAQAAQGDAPAPFKPTDHPAPDPANPGALVKMPKNPTRKPPTEASGGQVPAGAPPAPAQGATAPTQGAAPAQPFTGNETLPGVDINAIPKYKAPVNAPNTGASTEQDLNIKAQNAEKFKEMQGSTQQLRNDASERGLIRMADADIARLSNDPRMTGPGSPITKAWNELKAYATGKAPDPLVERQMLDKILLQLGANGVKRTLDGLGGGRVGQQEYLKILTEGNPTTAMAMGAIKRMVDFARYNNEFDTRLQNTKLQALNAGANPYSKEYADLEQGRAEYVQGRLGQANKPPPDVTEAQHNALPHGGEYYWKGEVHHKGVD